MKFIPTLAIILTLFFISGCDNKNNSTQIEFESLLKENWQKAFFDSCTGNWQDNWSLDGTRATVSNSENGMVFFAGNEHGNDTCHAVLWTKESFSGDIRIEYDFTKKDTQIVSVIIIYIQATGQFPYSANIHEWDSLRVIPSMSYYYNNMNTLHISYSAFDNHNSQINSDYIRARRYMPALKKGLSNTEIGQSYDNTNLFEQDKKYHITIIKKGKDLYMQIQNGNDKMLCRWNYDNFPLIEEGYIGLRHMYTRGAVYKDFRIFTKNNS